MTKSTLRENLANARQFRRAEVFLFRGFYYQLRFINPYSQLYRVQIWDLLGNLT